MWPAISLTLRILTVLYVGVVGILYALASLKLMTLSEALNNSVWIISLVVLAIDQFGTIGVRWFRSRRGKRTAEIEDTLIASLIQIVGSSGVHLEEIGANVYVASRWDRFIRKQHREVRLRRIARLRPGRYPQESGVAWQSGKGAVGECWEKKKRVYKLWHPVAAKYADADVDEAGFGRVSREARCGFTRGEFTSIVSKYAEVLAEPIWDPRKSGTMLGVITIDRAYKKTDPLPYIPQLDESATHESAGFAAGAVSRILKPRHVEE